MLICELGLIGFWFRFVMVKNVGKVGMYIRLRFVRIGLVFCVSFFSLYIF